MFLDSNPSILIPKLLVIVGPTASGKTDLSIKLAKLLNGEIISADSRQVYKGLNIGTAKPVFDLPSALSTAPSSLTPSPLPLLNNIPHHLIDIVSPTTNFDVAKFKTKARKIINDIIKRNKLPIIVGGTGFWVDSLIYDTNFPEVKPDYELRAKLDKKSVEQLFTKLTKLDPARAKSIETQNKRRLIRALEIVLTTGKPVPQNTSNNVHNREKKLNILNTPYNVYWIGININKDQLEYRIRKRFISWMNPVKSFTHNSNVSPSLIDEIKQLHSPKSKGGLGVSYKRMYELGLCYKHGANLLQNKINLKEFIELSITSILQYSRRQMTWFKRNKEITWISL